MLTVLGIWLAVLLLLLIVAFGPGDRPSRPAARRLPHGVCPRCNYIGDPRLCACVGALGRALKAGDLATALVHYRTIVADGNEATRLRYAGEKR